MADLYPNQLPAATGLTLADTVIVQQAGTPTVVERTTIQGMMTTQYTGTEKTVPVDADRFGLRDSVSGFLQYMTFANIKAAIYTAFGALLAAGTAKTTPVGADNLLIADSAASNATKKLSFTNLVAYLSGLCSAGWNAATATSVSGSVNATGAITSSSPTAGIGYASGAGGTVTQLTSITTAVTLNNRCGIITTVSHSFVSGIPVEFELINSTYDGNDSLLLDAIYGGDANAGPFLLGSRIDQTGRKLITIYPLFTATTTLKITFSLFSLVGA